MPAPRDAGGVIHTRSVEARALRLFDRYADMAGSEREAGLEGLRREDPALHNALAALLAADACERPLDRAPLAAVAAIMQVRSGTIQDPRIGTRVGAWRIVGVIGQGGMGTVYRVERADDQYEQTAALKFVRAEVSSEALVEAFREERKVLAGLSHPDIVPLLDGGVDEHGQPWFVMPQVEGEPIDAWCDRERLSLRDRVALFVQACDSIVYAHNRGILHQDIKPSNLLVTGDGRIQLLDFGLSVPTSGGGDGKRLAMTSGYTAPEILKGAAPGLAVDVYSLGILLCQLLCGRLPVAPAPARHAPQAPGALVGDMTAAMLAARQANNAAALRRQLEGELDSIVLQCIQEDPDARYPGVDRLQADLRNWLEGRPVSAYGDGFAYRSRCFIRRHAAASALIALAVTAVVAFAGTWTWQRVQAEREQVAASHVDRLLESSIGMATLSGMGDLPLTPAALLQRSEDYLRSEPLQGQADVRSRGLSILARNWAALGDYTRAGALAEEASAIDSGNALMSAFNLATLAQVQNLQALPVEAEVSARAGLALLPLRLSDQHQLARVRLLGQLAAAQSGQGDSVEAFATLGSAITLAEKLPRPHGDAIVAQVLIQRGTWYRWRHRMAESEADLLRAIALVQASDPVIADDARESLVRTVRAARAPGREARSLALAGELLESRRRTLGERSVQTGTAWAELVFIRLLNADGAGAQEAVDQARDILAKTVGQAHPAYARALIGQAFIDTLGGRIDAAIDQTRRALEIYRRSNGDTHEFTLDAKFLLASQYWSQYSRSGDPAQRKQALDLLGAAVADSVRAHGDVAAIHRMAYATLLANAGDAEGARAEIEQARQDAARQYGADSQESLNVRLAEISMAIDRAEPGMDIDSALARLQDDLGKIDTLYARAIAHSAWLQRGRWMTAQGRLDEARASYQQARKEAVDAGQQAWIQVADLKLGQLQSQAGVND